MDNQSKKITLIKYMFLTSTTCGALGVYFLFKNILPLGWIFVGIWAVLAITVRIIIIKDKKNLKK